VGDRSLSAADAAFVRGSEAAAVFIHAGVPQGHGGPPRIARHDPETQVLSLFQRRTAIQSTAPAILLADLQQGHGGLLPRPAAAPPAAPNPSRKRDSFQARGRRQPPAVPLWFPPRGGFRENVRTIGRCTETPHEQRRRLNRLPHERARLRAAGGFQGRSPATEPRIFERQGGGTHRPPAAARRVRSAAPHCRQGRSADDRRPGWFPCHGRSSRSASVEWTRGRRPRALRKFSRASSRQWAARRVFLFRLPVSLRGHSQDGLPLALLARRRRFCCTVRRGRFRTSFLRLIVPRQFGAPQRHFTSSTSASKR